MTKRISWIVFAMITIVSSALSLAVNAAHWVLSNKLAVWVPLATVWTNWLFRTLTMQDPTCLKANIGSRVNNRALQVRVVNVGPAFAVDRVVLRWKQARPGATNAEPHWLVLEPISDGNLKLATYDEARFQMKYSEKIAIKTTKSITATHKPLQRTVFIGDGSERKTTMNTYKIVHEAIQPGADPVLELYAFPNHTKPLVTLPSDRLLPKLKSLRR